MQSPRITKTAASATQRRLELLDRFRGELRQDYVRRFWLRWHMALMLVATIGAGFLVNHLLLLWPVHAMAWRWLLALVASYAAFFVCIKLWLAYVGARALLAGDWFGDVGANVDPGSPGWALPDAFRGGGGTSGGAGASSGWDGAGAIGDSSHAAIKASSDSALGGLSGGLDFDDGGALVIVAVVVLALVAVIGGSMVYLFTLAPAMLVDAAFSALLAGGLVKSVRHMDEPDWEGSVLRSSWKPFAVVAVVALIAASLVGYVAPGARTLGEILMLYR